MSKYAANSIGVPMSSTAATAQMISCYNASAAPVGQFRVFEWSCGPGANSADNTYGINALRTTAAPTMSQTITPNPLDAKIGAALTLAKSTSTAAAAGTVGLGTWGFHMRGGYRWVAIPGGELQVASGINCGITMTCLFAQGTDTCYWTMYFEE
jgi:hypothetical protein